LYYTRQAIEQVFDFSKNYANLLPVRDHTEESFRGHLFVSFMSTLAIMTIDRLLREAHPRSSKPKYNFLQLRSSLRQVKCDVYDDDSIVLPIEPDKKSRAIAENLKVVLPKKLPL